MIRHMVVWLGISDLICTNTFIADGKKKRGMVTRNKTDIMTDTRGMATVVVRVVVHEVGWWVVINIGVWYL